MGISTIEKLRSAPGPPGQSVGLVVDALRRIPTEIGAAEDLDQALRILAATAIELFAVDRARVYWRDRERDCFHGRVVHPTATKFERKVRGHSIGGPGDRLIGELVATGRPIAVANASRDPRIDRGLMREWNIRSLLVVPLIDSGDTLGVLYLDDQTTVRIYGEEEQAAAAELGALAAAAICRLEETLGLRERATELSLEGESLRLAAGFEARLDRLLADDPSLDGVAHALHDLTNRACSIFDAYGQTLAHAGDGGATWASSGIPDALAEGFFSSLQRAGEPTVLELDSGAQLLAASTLSRNSDGAFGAMVMLAGSRRGFGVLERRLLARVNPLVALHLDSEGLDGVGHDARRGFLAAQMRGWGGVLAPSRRARTLGFKLDARYVLCLVGDRTGAILRGDRRRAEDLAAVVGAKGCATAVDVPEGLALVLPIDSSAPAKRQARTVGEAVAAALTDMDQQAAGPRIAVSGSVALADVARAYGEAREILDCIRNLGDDAPRMLTAPDIGAARILLCGPGQADLRAFVGGAIGALLGDEPFERDLFETLKSYFDQSRSVTKTAIELGVHANTVRYRLGRIRDLAELDIVGSTADELTAQIALLILRLVDGAPGSSTEDR